MGTVTAGILLKHIIKYEQRCNIMLRSTSEILITSLAYPFLMNTIIWCMFNVNFLPVICELNKCRHFLLMWLIIKMQLDIPNAVPSSVRAGDSHYRSAQYAINSLTVHPLYIQHSSATPLCVLFCLRNDLFLNMLATERGRNGYFMVGTCSSACLWSHRALSRSENRT